MEEKVIFYEEAHIYLYDGWEIIPSVTQILKYKFPNKYQNVPEEVLKQAAEFGNNIHKAIEQFENGEKFNLSFREELVFSQYLKLKMKYGFEVIEQEQMINYKNVYAGRFDMILDRDGKLYLADIKTTSQLDLDYLSWQLSLYEYAYGQKFDGLVAIWLPKRKLGQYVKVERKSKEEIEKLLEEFKNAKTKR